MDEEFSMDGGDSVCAGLHDGDDMFYGHIYNSLSVFILSLDVGCLSS